MATTDYVSRGECERLRQSCPIGDELDKPHGIADQVAALQDGLDAERKAAMKAQHALEVRLVRLEILIPIATTILLKLVDWLPKLFGSK